MSFGGNGGGAPEAGNRLRAGELVRDGFALLRPRLQALALVGAASWIFNAAWLVYVTPEREPQLGFLVQLVSALIGAATGGWMIRAMLMQGQKWARPDGGFLGYVALTTVVGLPLAYLLTNTGGTSMPEQPIGVVFGTMILAIATLVVSVKLILWFVGVLVHRPVHPAESWRRTRGATLSYILASILVTLPPMFLAFLIASTDPDSARNPASAVGVVMTLATVVAEALSASVAAALWKARGEGR